MNTPDRSNDVPIRLQPQLAHCFVAACALAVLPALGLATSTTPGATAAPCAQAHPTEAQQSAQFLLERLRAQNAVPGMSSAFWQAGALEWSGCSGWRDLEAKLPVTRDTAFRLASVSKVFTATAVAELADRQQLNLDASLRELLPWLPKRWPDFTARQLASHTAGIAHYRDDDASLGERHFASAREQVRIFIERDLLSRPGSAYEYSSFGYNLLAAAIEARTQKSFVEHLQQRLTNGLAIGADRGGDHPDDARLYAFEGGAVQRIQQHDHSYTVAGGGLAGTADAVAEFAGRVMKAQVISGDARDAMWQPMHLDDGTPVLERGDAVALGWRISQDAAGNRIAHHAGVTQGGRSVLMLWPEQQRAISVLSNASWVASIEPTAMALAAPFSLDPNESAQACPAATQRFHLRLGERAITGEFSPQRGDGRCVLSLHHGDAFDDLFKAASARPEAALELIALRTDGRIGSAVLATPYGLYPLTRTAENRYSGAMAAGKEWELEW